MADALNPRIAQNQAMPGLGGKKQLSPPPPYTTLYNRFTNDTNLMKFKTDNYRDGVRQVINGRDYMVVKDLDGSSKLIPMRTPSAALFQYTYTK
jgi:glutamate receptor, ionotropic, invertebrate